MGCLLFSLLLSQDSQRDLSVGIEADRMGKMLPQVGGVLELFWGMRMDRFQ